MEYRNCTTFSEDFSAGGRGIYKPNFLMDEKGGGGWGKGKNTSYQEMEWGLRKFKYVDRA
jgi:hypothetical protein